MKLCLIAVALLAASAAEISIVEPAQVAAELAAKSSRPVVLMVGFDVLYRSKHIPGSIYAGPAARPDGIEMLKKAVEKLPRNREIVLYCGCCPWDHCPNVHPAFALLQQMGFTRVKVMHVPTNFKVDWIDHGYPVE